MHFKGLKVKCVTVVSFLDIELPRTRVPAMILIDSTASFEKRCNDMDETGGLLTGLRGQDIKGFSTMAFTMGPPQLAPTDN